MCIMSRNMPDVSIYILYLLFICHCICGLQIAELAAGNYSQNYRTVENTIPLLISQVLIKHVHHHQKYKILHFS